MLVRDDIDEPKSNNSNILEEEQPSDMRMGKVADAYIQCRIKFSCEIFRFVAVCGAGDHGHSLVGVGRILSNIHSQNTNVESLCAHSYDTGRNRVFQSYSYNACYQNNENKAPCKGSRRDVTSMDTPLSFFGNQKKKSQTFLDASEAGKREGLGTGKGLNGRRRTLSMSMLDGKNGCSGI